MPFLFLLPLVVAPTLMVLASLVDRRWGGAAAGYVTTAPYAVGMGIVVVTGANGSAAGTLLARSASGYVVAQLLCTLVFALVARRYGRFAGLLVGAAGYLGCVLAEQVVSREAAVLVSAAAVVAAAALIPSGKVAAVAPAAPGRVAYPLLFVRAAISLAAVGAVTSVAQLTGPNIAGAVAAFPITTTTLALLVSAGKGVIPLTEVLLGSVRGMPAYLAFTGGYWLATSSGATVPLGLTVATTGCLFTYGVAGHRSQRAARIRSAPVTAPESPSGTAQARAR